jgi:predicted nucleic acid-binding protein
VIVLDSSAAVDFLLGYQPHAEWVAEQLSADSDLHAPHLFDVEVLGAVRRRVLAGELRRRMAEEALADLLTLRVRRYPHRPLLERAWELRTTVTAADGVYAALAELLSVPLVTTDTRLSRAPGVRAVVLSP